MGRIEKTLNRDDLLYPSRRVQALGREHGFSVLALAEPFQNFAETQQTFLHGFDNTQPGRGHWNEQGHKLAAELIAEHICARRKAKRDVEVPE